MAQQFAALSLAETFTSHTLCSSLLLFTSLHFISSDFPRFASLRSSPMSSARKRSSSGPEPVARKPKHGINAAPQTLVSEEPMDSPDPNEADSAAEILTSFEENIPETAPDPAAQLDRSSPSTHSNSPSDAAQSTDAPPTDPSPRPEESEPPLPPSADRTEMQRWDDKVFGFQDCLGQPWLELQQHIHLCVVATFPSRCPWTLLSDDTKARFMLCAPMPNDLFKAAGSGHSSKPGCGTSSTITSFLLTAPINGPEAGLSSVHCSGPFVVQSSQFSPSSRPLLIARR
jgi:hypothetical protein